MAKSYTMLLGLLSLRWFIMSSVQENNKKIPDFLQDLAKTDTFDTDMAVKQKSSPLLKIYAVISVLWFGFLLLYLNFGFGWDNLSALLPDEFIRFFASLIIVFILILLLIPLVYKAYISANQTAAIEKGLSKILYADNENALAKIINLSLQKQIKQLTDMANTISQQNDMLKKELETKAQDFAKISEVIENCFSQNLLKLNENTQTMLAEYKIAAETAETFAVKADELKNGAVALTNELNPLINETIATADHLKAVMIESQDYIAQHSTDMENVASNNKKNLEQMSEILSSQTAKLEKTFLQTADSCEEIYKRLDSGISHIENSLKTHKQLACEQYELLDKNATYLDNKLGEYGKLISMEVEAMVERSSTLDINIEKQLDALKLASEKIGHVLDGANNSLEQKSVQASENIEKIVSELDNELSKLNDFISKTENKNNEIKETAEKITDKIGNLSTDLGLKVDDLKLRAVEAIDKFNEVSAVVQRNTIQLSESANVIVTKGKEGSGALEKQHESIVLALSKFEDIKNKINEIEQNITKTNTNASNSFEQYQTQVKGLGLIINEQIAELDNHKIRSERHLKELKQQYDSFSVTNFMNESKALVTKLENLSVDINRFVDAKEEDDLWKKFYNGDHAVFVRNIVKNLNRKQIIKIRDEYEKNADFRVLADNYITNFETLLTAAGNAEKADAILAMISGSDIGKIYYVIARATDRLK